MEVLALLKDKARRVHTIASCQTIGDAVCLMASAKASALLVMKNDRPAGIFSEGDVFKSLLKCKPAELIETKLETAMSRNLLLAGPKDPITFVLDKMVEADLTHLPVIEDKKFVGMLTLKDLMKHHSLMAWQELACQGCFSGPPFHGLMEGAHERMEGLFWVSLGLATDHGMVFHVGVCSPGWHVTGVRIVGLVKMLRREHSCC